MRYHCASDIVLDDVFLDLPGLLPDAEVSLKIEGFNPAGSIKLKTAVGLLDDAEASGILRAGDRIIESSSGNLGIALSSVCAARGYHFTCVADPNTTKQGIALMRSFGAEVVVVSITDGSGGYLQSRINYIHQRLAIDSDLVWLNQYANQANPRAHYDRTAARIFREFPRLDFLFVGAGTTGTVTGCGDYFKRNSPGTRIIAVDAEGSVTFGFPPGPRHIPGLGASRCPEIVRPDLIDEVVLVPEAEAISMCRRMARVHGIALGGSTGSVLAAIIRLRERIRPGATVVAVSPDNGDRYLDTVYDDRWVARHFGPVTLDACLASAGGESRDLATGARG